MATTTTEKNKTADPEAMGPEMNIDHLPPPTKDNLPNAAIGSRGVQLANLSEMSRFATIVIQSGLAPKECQTASNALIRIQMGLEVGLSPMQAIQSICVINGTPSMWGTAVKGLVFNSGHCQNWTGRYVGTPYDDDYGYEALVQRKGMDPQTYLFTVADAKKAGLWGKNTWASYPKDMLMHRANGRAAKDQFPDVLKGLEVAEVAQDYVDIKAEEVKPTLPPSGFTAAMAQKHGAPEPPMAPETPIEAPESDDEPDKGMSLRELRAFVIGELEGLPADVSALEIVDRCNIERKPKQSISEIMAKATKDQCSAVIDLLNS